MSYNMKMLSQIKPANNALTLLYKAPTTVSYTSLSLLNVCNQDNVNNYFSITVAQGDVTSNSAQYVYSNNTIGAYTTTFVTPALTLLPNDAIYVSTTQRSSTQILDSSGSSNTANLSISVSAGSPNVTGSNTNFTTLSPGSYILVTGATPSTQLITSITNATSLVVGSNYTGSISDTSAYILGFGDISYSLSGMEVLALPTISSISVSTGSAGGGTTVIITGKFFTGATAVKFGSNFSSYTVNSDTQITAVSPATSYASVVDITVITAAGSSVPNFADEFTYYLTQPVITSISPSTGLISGDETVIIMGSGFTQSILVKFGANYATFVVNSDTEITATSPQVGAVGTVDISVTTTGGTSSIVTADEFTYTLI